MKRNCTTCSFTLPARSISVHKSVVQYNTPCSLVADFHHERGLASFRQLKANTSYRTIGKCPSLRRARALRRRVAIAAENKLWGLRCFVNGWYREWPSVTWESSTTSSPSSACFRSTKPRAGRVGSVIFYIRSEKLGYCSTRGLGRLGTASGTSPKTWSIGHDLRYSNQIFGEYSLQYLGIGYHLGNDFNILPEIGYIG